MTLLETARALLATLLASKEPIARVYANLSELDAGQEKYLRQVCKKHEFTLSLLGLSTPEPAAPSFDPLPDMDRFIDFQKGAFIIKTSDSDAVHIHMVSKVSYDRRNGLYYVPYRLHPVLRLHAFAKETGIPATEAAEQAVESMYAEMRARYRASMAHDAEIDMGEFGLALDPYQRAGVKGAARFKRGFIADEMGLGKTRQALGVLWIHNARPALVICPNSVVIGWEKEAEEGLKGWKIFRCTSKSAPEHICKRSQLSITQESDSECDRCRLENADLVIMNYHKVADGWKCQFDESGKKIKGRKRKKGERAEVQLSSTSLVLADRRLRAVIIDESQSVKNEATQLAKGVHAVIGRPEIRLALSGTPVKSRTSEFVEQLRILDRLDDMGGEEVFYRSFCGDISKGDTKGSSKEKELNQLLRACGFIQRNKRDIKKELPPIRECKLWVDIDNREEYTRVETDLANWCAEQAVLKEEFQKMLSRLSPDVQADIIERKMIETRLRTMRAMALIKVGALRRVAFKGQLATAIEWIGEFLQTGKKLVVFAELRKSQYAVQEKFNALHIFGKDTVETRKIHENIYMGKLGNTVGLNQQIIVCSNMSAREGVSLDAGDDILVIERPWTPADERQIVARIDRHRIHNINAYKIIANDTIGAKIDQILSDKEGILDAVTKGETGLTKLKIVDDLIAEFGRLSTHKIDREYLVSNSLNKPMDEAPEYTDEEGD